MTTANFYFYLQNRLIQTSQTGGQWYCDISPLSIRWPVFISQSLCVSLGPCLSVSLSLCLSLYQKVSLGEKKH
jgi:hypothetical protein